MPDYRLRDAVTDSATAHAATATLTPGPPADAAFAADEPSRFAPVYPFPRLELTSLFQRYPHAGDIRWVQEEPANMGAWRNTRHRLEGVLPEGATLRLVARKAASTPASGFYPLHVEQERQLIERALREGSPGEAPRSPGRAGARRERA